MNIDRMITVYCDCGDLIGYAPRLERTQMDAICGNCAVTRPERAALAEIREIVQAALAESDLSKLDLKRILGLCGKDER